MQKIYNQKEFDDAVKQGLVKSYMEDVHKLEDQMNQDKDFLSLAQVRENTAKVTTSRMNGKRKKHQGCGCLYRRKMSQIVAAALLIFVMGATTAIVAGAFYRNTVVWKVEEGTINDSLHFSVPEGQTVPATIERVDTPAYIPWGYHIEKETTDVLSYRVSYSNGDKCMDYMQTTYGTGLGIDSEDMTVSTGEIHGYPARKYTKQSRTIVVWTTEEYVYMVSGEASDRILTKMAESVRYEK